PAPRRARPVPTRRSADLDLPKAAPRALDSRAQVRFLREAERASARDRAIAYTACYAGPRIHGLAALDIDDIPMSARKGTLIIRKDRQSTRLNASHGTTSY